MLTDAQKTALATAVAADSSFNGLTHNSDGAYAIAEAFNQPASPAFYVWNSNVPMDAVYDAITWANLTPADAPDGTATWTNRSLACQGRQFNIQIILQGKNSLNAAKTKQRNGLKDALQNVPAGANGALVDAGWVALKDVIYRNATRFEALVATGTGTTGIPGTTTYEGTLNYQDVQSALGW